MVELRCLDSVPADQALVRFAENVVEALQASQPKNETLVRWFLTTDQLIGTGEDYR